jgi:hypothetical protein
MINPPDEVYDAIQKHQERNPNDDLVSAEMVRETKTLEIWEIRFEERSQPRMQKGPDIPYYDRSLIPTFILKPTKVTQIRIPKKRGKK